jgi:hypothetical protein
MRNVKPFIIKGLQNDENSITHARAELNTFKDTTDESADQQICVLLGSTFGHRMTLKSTKERFNTYPILKVQLRWIVHDYNTARMHQGQGMKQFEQLVNVTKKFVECFCLFMIRDVDVRLIQKHDQLISSTHTNGAAITTLLLPYRKSIIQNKLQSLGTSQVFDGQTLEQELAAFSNTIALDRLIEEKYFNLLLTAVVYWIEQYHSKRVTPLVRKVVSLTDLDQTTPYIAAMNEKHLGDFEAYSVIIDGIVIYSSVCVIEAFVMLSVAIELWNIHHPSALLQHLFQEVVQGTFIPRSDQKISYLDLKQDLSTFFKEYPQYAKQFPVDVVFFTSTNAVKMKQTPTPQQLSLVPLEGNKRKSKPASKKNIAKSSEAKPAKKKIPEQTHKKTTGQKRKISEAELTRKKAKASSADAIPDSFEEIPSSFEESQQSQEVACSKCGISGTQSEFVGCFQCPSSIRFCDSCSLRRLRKCCSCEHVCCTSHCQTKPVVKCADCSA